MFLLMVLSELLGLTTEDGLGEEDKGRLVSAVTPDVHNVQRLPADHRRRRLQGNKMVKKAYYSTSNRFEFSKELMRRNQIFIIKY